MQLTLNQSQLITFVMIDAFGNEIAGLGGGYTLEVSKAGGAFNAGAGAKAEIGNGWYSYLITAAEADTVGPISIRATGAGTIQQNLLFFVEGANAGCSSFTYTVTNSVNLLPMSGVEVWFTTDLAGTSIVWYGVTDALGVARDAGNNLPCLDPGSYYVWKKSPGFSDDDNPDIEVVT